MREILYRAKAINRDRGYHQTNYKNGDFVYGLVTRLYDERFENLPAVMTNTDGITGIEVDDKTIGQYTGLTDKNGTRIFEGDIVSFQHPFKNRHGIYLVSFIGSGFNCKNFYQPHFDNPCDAFSEGTEYFEVIGNIYDTPELLKGANYGTGKA